MFIARYSVDVRFGHKDDYIQSSRVWQKEIGDTLGWKPRVLTGSIGANESRFEMELEIPTLESLEQAWAKLGTSEAHKRWGREMEKFIVSGTNRWEIFRVVEL